ncbi:hypothetical protein NV226_02660 [Mycoplasma iguanae]|uniref:Uncharacterized protein n=1 Tax=Mycoplasma iguanae TaxID=292461 RepID=A0ABY5R8J2_9MOLU|nr:hypothetical protein [Mycoplasma iguanae]UVD81601.1 hypothetical protein NV226_02660 [Mycoplasma iguanae]
MTKSKKTLAIVGGVGAVWVVGTVITAAVIGAQASQKKEGEVKGNVSKLSLETSARSFNSVDLKFDFNTDKSKDYINLPLRIDYWIDGTEKTAAKLSKPFISSSTQLTVTLGSLESGKKYNYEIFSANSEEKLEEGSFETRKEPTFQVRSSSATSIDFLFSNLDPSYLARSFSVRYREKDKPEQPLKDKIITLGNLDTKPNTESTVYELLNALTDLKPDTEYLINVYLNNTAGALISDEGLNERVVRTKSVPTITVVNKNPYSASFKLENLRGYAEDPSSTKAFLEVSYETKPTTETAATSTSTPIKKQFDVTTLESFSFDIYGLAADKDYEFKFAIRYGNSLTELATHEVKTLTKTDLKIELTEEKSTISLTNANNLETDITDLVFAWVVEPLGANVKLRFSDLDKVSMSKDSTTETTAKVEFSKNTPDSKLKLEPGQNYIGQVFRKDDKEFKTPLLEKNAEFKLLKALKIDTQKSTIQDTTAELTIDGLNQFAEGTQLTLYATEVTVSASSSETGAASSTPAATEIKADYTVTKNGTQKVTFSGLSASKTYEVKVYLKSDTSKSNSLFSSKFVFETTATASSSGDAFEAVL